MAILFESTTAIELLLKQALDEANLHYYEQQRIYEHPGDIHPKYVLDFVVINGSNKIAVECDGEAYHSSDGHQYSALRDNWLLFNGYKDVLHFTTHQLKSEMPKVILNIKNSLGIISLSPTELRFAPPKSRKHSSNVDPANLHSVFLYYYSKQVKDHVYLVYQYYDATRNYYSDERIKVFSNVPDNKLNALSIFAALKDLKRSVILTVYCPSHWIVKYFSGNSRSSDDLLIGIRAILKRHNYLFRYFKLQESPSFYSASDTCDIIRQLRSRCRQIAYRRADNYDSIDYCEFVKEPLAK